LKKIVCFIVYLLLINVQNVKSQSDTLPYEFYDEKIVLYTDFGFSTAPFSIHYKFKEHIDQIKYRNNYKNQVGFGVSYKWASLRLSFAVGNNARPINRYGRTNYGSLGFNFTFKKFYFDIEAITVKGYAVKNAYKWDQNLTIQNPNEIKPSTISYSTGINTWYFHNKLFKMQALMGKTGHFIKEVRTWYIKSTFNIYGLKNDENSLIPSPLIETNNSKTASNSYSAIDFGFVPGYAYANRIKNWQISALFGLGGVIQAKSYNVKDNSRSFLGLAPRYDIKIVGGYSSPSFFLFLVSDFNNKTIRFNDLVIKQSFYTLKLVGGIRLNALIKKKKTASI